MYGALDDSPCHRRGGDERHQETELDAASDDQRLSPVPSPPGRHARIGDKHQDQDHSGLRDQLPGIGDARRDRHHFAEELDPLQGQHRPVSEILSGLEIDDEHQRAHDQDGPGEPPTPGPQIDPHEPRRRQEPRKQRHMRPPERDEQLIGRRRPHHPQFAEGECRHRRRAERKQEMDPLAAVPEPDQEVHRRQRQAGRRDHRPHDGHPAQCHRRASRPARAGITTIRVERRCGPRGVR